MKVRALIVVIAAVALIGCETAESGPPDATATAAGGVATPATVRSDEPSSTSAWAAGVCAADRAFGEALAQLDNGFDPNSLDLESRIEIIIKGNDGLFEAANGYIVAVSALSPPADVAFYQDALVGHVGQIVDVIEAQRGSIVGALTVADIDAADEAVIAELDRGEALLDEAAGRLPYEAVFALTVECEKVTR